MEYLIMENSMFSWCGCARQLTAIDTTAKEDAYWTEMNDECYPISE